MEIKPANSQPAEIFEEVAVEKHFEFPPYKAADVHKLSNQYLPRDFKGMIKAILEVEAPLSEDLLLKRIVGCFGREKVTSAVLQSYEQRMNQCRQYGIIRRNGFLYLDSDKEISFREPCDIECDIKQIVPEELAAGLLEILKQNVTADKNELYRSLAAQCGVNRLGKTINEAMDSALYILNDRIVIDSDQISLK